MIAAPALRSVSVGVRVAVLGSVLSACATPSPVGPVRFVNAPVVERVDDRRPIAEPRKNPFLRGFYKFDALYLRTARAVRLTRHRRALGVNSLDEVPDSTWFTNRIGVRDISPELIERGPGVTTPEAHLPWQIKSAKEGGTVSGFVIEDARGLKFLLKFDEQRVPETETGADAVVARLLWAVGYNVPADHVVYFKRSDLQIAPDAYFKVNGKKRPIDDKFVDAKLQQVTVGPDGRIRGLASGFITGELLGGTHRLGVRRDDPNDVIAHELRRDQRGQAPVFAWLSHTDAKEDNSLDVWQTDAAETEVHYVVHYLLDFGKSLGTMAKVNRQPHIGYRHELDPTDTVISLATLGLYRWPWEFTKDVEITGVGVYRSDHYDPAAWKANLMAQLPLIWADRFDQFWGAKLLIRFTPAHLAAAVRAGRYSDPRASAYLLETLIARQRITARYWFRRVNPIDELAFDAGQLCFTDLALRHQLETIPTTFRISAYDATEHSLGTDQLVAADAHGRACLAAPTLATTPDRYTIFRIASSRSGLPETLIHVAAGTDGAARVIGIHRL